VVSRAFLPDRYSSTKFALEGFSEAMALEIAQFGIKLTIVELGAFRTRFLDRDTLRYGNKTIPDYADFSSKTKATVEARNHRQIGNPAWLAKALLMLAEEPNPPLRYVAGSNAAEKLDTKLRSVSDELAKWRELSLSTDEGCLATLIVLVREVWLGRTLEPERLHGGGQQSLLQLRSPPRPLHTSPPCRCGSCHVEASTQSSDRGGSLLLFDVPRPLADYEDLALRRIKLTAFRTRLYFGASPSISRALAASRSHAWIEAVSASCLGTLRQLKSHTC
jgi:hypothetical protein